MIFLIYPSDPTTSFLEKILDELSDSIGAQEVSIISCGPSDEAYGNARQAIKNIPSDSTIVFMGHSTAINLFGGASEGFKRKFLISLADMSIFSDKTLILMSCYSASLLISSRKVRNYSSSIGFGLLPSDYNEIIGKKHLEDIGIDVDDIEEFKRCLIQIFVELIKNLLIAEKTTEEITDLLKLLINIKINNYLIENNNTKLAKLLYYMYVEVHGE